MNVDPALSGDKQFLRDLERLSRAFETKLGALRTAHELAQQKLISEARLRNQLPMDVSDLMFKAAERGQREQESKRAMEDAADISVLQGVAALGNPPSRPVGLPRSSQYGRQSPVSSPALDLQRQAISNGRKMNSSEYPEQPPSPLLSPF